ncbi:TolC family protein [Candidatus Accumulibacter sp. ACC007]|uniref:TolC family protein n=1 Tax=Candidatus Accumulibacter sp. ACC007 TaxID=2823333 RepID=UPI0025C21314|nr:TolC family protein [Candidatus Accumulibacter sp. ACC007]
MMLSTPSALTARLAAAGCVLLALVLANAPAYAQGPLAPPLGASLSGLLSYAREHNPELGVRKFEAQAARERVEPAAALPDPRFELELMDFTNTMNPDRSPSLLPGQVGNTRYRVVQPLPFWGKRELRGEVAEALAEQVETMQEGTALEVENRIKTAYARQFQASGQIRILRETLSLLDAIEQLVLTRYGVGLVPQQDALRAQSELTSVKIDLVEAERRRRDNAAKLNALLARDGDAPLAEPVRLPSAPDRISYKSLLEQIRTRSPEVARERFGVVAAEKGRELTWLNRYPDFAVGLTNNRPYNASDNWEVMVGVTIPLQQSSRRAQEREAERRLEAAQTRVVAAETRLAGRLGEALAAFEASRDKARLLKDTLLPQASATFEAAQSGYESGRVNFNTLIDAERQILRARLALLDADVETAVRLAELEFLVGAPL